MIEKAGPDKTIVIVGAGTMGTGLAWLCASQGFHVYGTDVSESACQRAHQAFQDLTHKHEKRNPAVKKDIGSFFRGFSTRYDHWPLHITGVIEAVYEDESVKASALQHISAMLPPFSWLATNTSSLSVSRLAKHVTYPERFLGLHFFNPPDVMPLVEVIPTTQTSQDVRDRVATFVSLLQKEPVYVKDEPGFIVNRLLLRTVREAIVALEEGIASTTDIDKAMVHGAHHPMGPLALADFIGLDICQHILETLAVAWPDRLYEPPSILKCLVAKGHLGKKTGQGFYDYTGSSPSPAF